MRCDGILVSFCNVRSQWTPVLGVFEPESRRLDVILRGVDVPQCTGFTGLAVSAEHVFAVAQLWQRPPCLFTLDRRTLQLVTSYDFIRGQDIHSIVVANDTLFAVSTGTDEVLRLRRRGASLDREEVLWRPDPQLSGFDVHHLNGACYHDDHLVISGFGKRTADRWDSALDGKIWELRRKSILRDGGEHPHSPASDGRTIFFCESRRRMVREVDSSRSSPRLPGYARGLCVQGDRLFVGTSEGRAVSKSTGTVNDRRNPAQVAGFCSIARLSPDLAVQEIVDLSPYGSEIYDIVPR